MLPTFEDYCLLIANLPDQFPSICSSTLTAYRIGPFAAEVEGQLTFTRPNLPALIEEVERLLKK